MSKTLKVLLIIFGAVVLIGGGLVGYYKYGQKPAAPAAVVQTTPSVSPTKSATSEPAVSLISDTGVSWISPKKVEDLGILKNDPEITEISYYQVADLDGGGGLYIAIIQLDMPGGPYLFRFKKDSANKYFYLAKYSSLKTYGDVADYLAASVQFDNTTAYKSLSLPDFLTVKNTTMKVTSSEGLFSELTKTQEVASTAYGKLYKTLPENAKAETDGIYYPLKLQDGTYRGFTIKAEFLSDNEVPAITWSDGTKNSARYTPEGYTGCGSVATDNVITNTANITSRLTEIGTASNGDKIYKVAATDPIVKAAYDNYKSGRNGVMDITQFANAKAVFVWKAGLGDYVIFTGRDYGSLAECGKPVIYLYPEKTMPVSVKVGAEITKSEPLYNGGWNVTAEPSGKLTVNGKTYDSLFWEGTGQEYPEIKEGVVVNRVDVEKTVKMQLAQLGLNSKETGDFWEFWAPKMPAAPYVRLTWFGTAQMNELAPLVVTPSPQTLIRVFLDFEGLSQPQALAPQHLAGVARQGFTVVEWGGLLRK